MIVDVHTHVIPRPLVDRAQSAGGLLGVHERDGSMVHPEGFTAPLGSDFFDVEALLSRMDSGGIDRSVVSLSPTLFFYDKEEPAAIEFAVEANDAIAELVGESNRLDGLAQLPMQSPAAAADELERAVGELGLRGAQIGTNVGATPLDAESLRPILEAAARLRVPLMLHPYFVGPKPGLEAYYLTNTIGNPLDTTVAASRLLLSGTLSALPELEIILVHAAGFLPYQLGRLDHAHRVREDARGGLAELPSESVKRFWVDTLSHRDESLQLLLQTVGADRLLTGTDLPYDMADADPIARAARVGLDADELGANACRALGLDHQ